MNVTKALGYTAAIACIVTGVYSIVKSHRDASKEEHRRAEERESVQKMTDDTFEDILQTTEQEEAPAAVRKPNPEPEAEFYVRKEHKARQPRPRRQAEIDAGLDEYYQQHRA